VRRKASLWPDSDGKFTVTPSVGLAIKSTLSYDAWLRLGKQLSIVATSSAWCLGDWLVHGERQFNGRYRAAVEQSGLDYKTLRNYAWVAKRFPMERRREDLSFGHHAEVAALSDPEQKFWLEKAKTYSWSRNELRNQIRLSLRERSPEADKDNEVSTTNRGEVLSTGQDQCETFRLNVTSDQLMQWKQAADKAGLSVEDWVINTLKRATN
jgi:hypothetical protein